MGMRLRYRNLGRDVETLCKAQICADSAVAVRLIEALSSLRWSEYCQYCISPKVDQVLEDADRWAMYIFKVARRKDGKSATTSEGEHSHLGQMSQAQMSELALIAGIVEFLEKAEYIPTRTMAPIGS